MTTTIIYLRVAGTNPQTREQRYVNKRFNAEGQELNNDGQVIAGAVGLKINLNAETESKVPQLPAAYYEAMEKGNVSALKEILAQHAEAVAKWDAANGGGSIEVRIAKAALQYCYEQHGFIKEDGDGFVLKLENLDVKTDKVEATQSTYYQVAGTAIFGGPLTRIGRIWAAITGR